MFLAKMVVAIVVACASSEAKIKRLSEPGADRVIDCARGEFMAEVHARFGKPQRRPAEGGVDVVINFTGGDTWVPSLPALGSNDWTQDDLVTLLKMVDERRLSPVIDRVVRLAEAGEGLRLLLDREVIGKMIVVPGSVDITPGRGRRGLAVAASDPSAADVEPKGQPHRARRALRGPGRQGVTLLLARRPLR